MRLGGGICRFGRTILGRVFFFIYFARACWGKMRLELGVSVARQALWAGAQGATKPHQSQQVTAVWLKAALAFCLQFACDQPDQSRTEAIGTPGPKRLARAVLCQARPGQAK